jgi:hypothetical protein
MSKAGFNIQTPRGMIVINGDCRAEIVWNAGFGQKVSGALDVVQAWIDNEVLARCNPYVPMDSSMLNKSGILFTVLGSGEVIYSTPYARRHYYNQPLVDSLGRHYGPSTFQGAPMRGAYWFERMKNEGGKEAILRGAQIMLERQKGR